jgi:hypothetical protein
MGRSANFRQMAPQMLLDRPSTKPVGKPDGDLVSGSLVHSTETSPVSALPPVRSAGQGGARADDLSRMALASTSAPRSGRSLQTSAVALEQSPDDATSVRDTSSVMSSALDDAVARLARVAIDTTDAAERAAAARALRAASAERRASAPRVASVALVLSDALTFTPDRDLTPGARESLKTAARTLMEPFVSTQDEEDVFSALISSGWQVTPFFDPQAFASLSSDQEI